MYQSLVTVSIQKFRIFWVISYRIESNSKTIRFDPKCRIFAQHYWLCQYQEPQVRLARGEEEAVTIVANPPFNSHLA